MDDSIVRFALSTLPRELAQAVLAMAAEEADLPAGTLASQHAVRATGIFASEYCWAFCPPKCSCHRCYGSDGPSIAAVDWSGTIVG